MPAPFRPISALAHIAWPQRSAPIPLEAGKGLEGGTDIWKPVELTRLLRTRDGVSPEPSSSPPLQHPQRSPLPLCRLPAVPMLLQYVLQC